MRTVVMSKADLVEWFESVDFSCYSQDALEAAYDALVGDTEDDHTRVTADAVTE